ncbi:MAG: efflux RND transporter periplasmic adaptor subunit, partial [Spirochaetales bacterium]|nr:efflux RND transporter periplasmic adaptor subunit [Spirochaetales bacterium]
MNLFYYKRGRATGRNADGTLRSSRFSLKRFVALAVGAAIFMSFLIITSCGRPAEAQGLDADGSPPERATEAERRIPVRVAATELTEFVDYGEYVGEARGVSEVRLTADAGGRVTMLLAEEGDLVGRGASLAEVDPELARATYETAVLNERITRETYEREQRFLQQGNSFQLRVDEAHLAWLQARSSLLDAEKTREGAFAITPIDGTVLNRHIELHQDLEEGDPTFDVADLSRITISVGVPEADIAGVRELEEAEITFAAFPERVFRGTPTSFARGRSDRTLSYEVDIEV